MHVVHIKIKHLWKEMTHIRGIAVQQCTWLHNIKRALPDQLQEC